MGPRDRRPAPRRHHSSAVHVSGALPSFASSCYFKSVPWGDTGQSPRKGRSACPSQVDIWGLRQSTCTGGFPVLVLICRLPGRADEDSLSIQIPASLALISKSQRARRCCSPRRRGRRRPLLRAPGCTSHHLQDSAQTAGSVTSRALPENGSKTLGNECRSLFPKGQHRRKPPTRAIHSQTAQGRRGLPQITASSESVDPHTHRKLHLSAR